MSTDQKTETIVPLTDERRSDFKSRCEIYQAVAIESSLGLSLITALERARKYDAEHGEPECELESKKALLRKIAEALGLEINLEAATPGAAGKAGE